MEVNFNRGARQNAPFQKIFCKNAPRAGIEPATRWLTATCSATELPGNDNLLSR